MYKTYINMRRTVRVPVTEGSLQLSGTIAPHGCPPQSSELLSYDCSLTHKNTKTKTVQDYKIRISDLPKDIQWHVMLHLGPHLIYWLTPHYFKWNISLSNIRCAQTKDARCCTTPFKKEWSQEVTRSLVKKPVFGVALFVFTFAFSERLHITRCRHEHIGNTFNFPFRCGFTQNDCR